MAASSKETPVRFAGARRTEEFGGRACDEGNDGSSIQAPSWETSRTGPVPLILRTDIGRSAGTTDVDESRAGEAAHPGTVTRRGRRPRKPRVLLDEMASAPE
ncbi:hypothetical protein GCM10023083_20570 [Streptomyces phyllanthi]